MRYLALDLGDRRIGVAVSDATGILARPLEMFRRSSRAADFAHIAALVAQHDIAALVVGLPLNMNGTEGTQAAWVRDYCAALTAVLERPVVLWDERLTTEEAADVLHLQGRRADKTVIDAVAAAVILQSYLDHVKKDEGGRMKAEALASTDADAHHPEK